MDIELLKEIFKFQTLNGLGNKAESSNWSGIIQALFVIGFFITIWIIYLEHNTVLFHGKERIQYQQPYPIQRFEYPNYVQNSIRDIPRTPQKQIEYPKQSVESFSGFGTNWND